MNTMVESAWKILAAFTHSDVYGTSPLWHILLTAMVAHMFVGTALALLRVSVRLRVAVLVFWLAKELLGDIPNGNYALVVMLDSSVDLLCGVLGFWFGRFHLRKACALG